MRFGRPHASVENPNGMFRSCNQTVTGFSPAWQAAINPARVPLDRMLRETERVYCVKR